MRATAQEMEVGPPEPPCSTKMINAKAGTWASSYGRFRPQETAYVLFHIDRYLVRWARRTYKHLRRAPRRAWQIAASSLYSGVNDLRFFDT